MVTATTVPPNLLLGVVTAVLAFFLIRGVFYRRPKLPLPPGPKSWSIFGNITDMPPRGQAEWKHWLKHMELYGPVSSVTAMGQTIIIIHDKQAALELMEKRATVHSGRPTAIFAMEMCGLDNILASRQPGPRLNLHRKLAMSQLGSQSSIMKFAGLQELETEKFLVALVDNSGAGLDSAIKSMIGSMLLKMIYGYRIETAGPDPLVKINDRLVEIFASVTLPGAWLVDAVPWLKYLPDWMPGTGFKSVARQGRQVVTASAEVPFRFTKQHTSDTDFSPTQPEPSVVGELLHTAQKDKSISDEVIQWTASSLYGAGVDTTGSTLRTFFLAMSVYPDVQRRAQKEIDEVVGRSRLPRQEDRSNLPYVAAVIKESLRWLPSVPLGVPHVAQKDDELHGFRIPKGAILMPSTWWFTRDPAVYHDPERFLPERFLPERFLAPFDEPDPAGFVFGFGRRMCPGRRLAESTLFLTVAKVLATFDISKGRDSQGREVEPEIGIGPGAVAAPFPFSVTITTRNQALVQLIRSVEREHSGGEGDSKYLDQDLAQFMD